MAKKQLMTQKEFAEHIGKSPQYVNKLVNDGKILLVIEHGKKLVDPKQALDAMNAFSKVGKVIGVNRDGGKQRASRTVKPPAAARKARGARDGSGKVKAANSRNATGQVKAGNRTQRVAAVKPPKPDSATRQLTKFRTEEQEAVAGMAKLKYAQLRGELLPANDVREAQRMKNQNIKQKFWSLPRSAAETLARLATPRECEDFLRGEIAKIFDKLHSDVMGMKESSQTAGAVVSVAESAVQTFANGAAKEMEAGA